MQVAGTLNLPILRPRRMARVLMPRVELSTRCYWTTMGEKFVRFHFLPGNQGCVFKIGNSIYELTPCREMEA